MADFNKADQIRKANEGLYNPGGRGINETYAGIDRGANPNWPGWKIIDSHKPALVPQMNLALSLDKSLQISIINFYVVGYWNPLKLSQIVDQNIANNAYDCAVNQGVGIAAKFMQRACNGLKIGLLVEDGLIGNKTLAAINSLDPELVFNEINNLRRDRYIDTANSNPDFKQWLKPWLKRLVPYNHSIVNH